MSPKALMKLILTVLTLITGIIGYTQDTLTLSNLPIVSILTNGNVINPDSGIVAEMGIIYNGPGEINQIDDPFNNYSGRIRIKYRGSTSLTFPKKSFSLETQDSLGQNLNVSLVDMPSENDWVLQGPFSDKSLMRNVVIYELARKMGWYAPRTKFCELLLDSTYQGIYVLTEKIKEDADRVNIATVTPNDTIGEELTGGYMVLVDRWEGDGWLSNFTQYVFFEYYEPQDDEILPVQKAYIKNYINNIEYMLDSLTVWDHELMDTTLNLQSFYDYFILNELAKNVDSYRLSTYMFKDKDSNDGRLTMGPIWDYNIAFGNCEYYDGFLTSGYIYSDSIYFNNAIFWFRKLMEFEPFQDSLKCRWEHLRNSALHLDSISASIDSVKWFLDDAKERNFLKWNILGQYVWPNYFVGETYEEEVDYLKEWIEARLEWLDNNLPGTCPTSSQEVDETEINRFTLYPNPFTNHLTLKLPNEVHGDLQITIFNQLGKVVFRAVYRQSKHASVQWELPDLDLAPGMYFYQICEGQNKSASGKIIKVF